MTPGNPIRPDQIDPLRSIQPTQETEEGMGGNFAEMMQPGSTKMSPSQAPSPMNILPGTNPVSGPSYETMQKGLQVSQNQLSDMQAQAQTPNLRIKPQDNTLLTKNMTNANENLRTVNTKIGVDPGPHPKALDGPLGKFVGLINDGSNQISSAKQQLSKISSDPTSLNPAEMLLVQVKINQAQQQIEFSSILLSKVVDDFKQLMNIQI